MATMSIEASTSTSVLLAYLEQVLVPALKRTKPDAILVMDNLRPHHATEVRTCSRRPGSGFVPAALFAGVQPDRARLGQGERAAQGKSATHS